MQNDEEQVAELLPVAATVLACAPRIQRLSLAKSCSIGRAIGRQEEHVSADAADRTASGFALVATEIGEDDDVALDEGWGEHLLDMEREEFAVDVWQRRASRTLEHFRAKSIPVRAKTML
ncbi:MAG TPA: hypothetical protein VGV58_05880 [Bosea sp. (in: a-proteobacteria)]|nr:hypothetical protein [Bosea sp. (in: a-proteobacteria)]HEV2509074.1 hypothetical protein [Bosea sp. (in: a-proteobacteria)]